MHILYQDCKGTEISIVKYKVEIDNPGIFFWWCEFLNDLRLAICSIL